MKAKAKLSVVSLCRLSMLFYYSFIQFISYFIKEKFIFPSFPFFNMYENCNKKAHHLGQYLQSPRQDFGSAGAEKLLDAPLPGFLRLVIY